MCMLSISPYSFAVKQKSIKRKHRQLKMAFLRDIFNMGESKNAYENMYGGGNYEGYQREQHHHSSWTHELVAGGAGFAGEIFFSI